MSFDDHICGCYFVHKRRRLYLPQVRLDSHTTINPVSYTTQLTQTFRNPTEEPISQLRYTFPLYDGVAVNGYTITYQDQTLVGVVKQKEDAKQTFQAAVDRGESAGLLESLPAGVFGVTLGNVTAKDDAVVSIEYAGELKHDASIDGLRYMLPTSIAPRYGNYPGEVLQTNLVEKAGISITVDVDMRRSAIRRVQSPSHPIALSMGELSTAAQDKDTPSPFSPSQASITLTQGTAELAGDFVLQLLIDDISKPQAILEVHPTLPAQRAIMATMVPKFVLEPSHSEIVFIADQSGSMSGTKNAALVKALIVFLKSLPVGTRFNICAFGSRHEFLWPKSQAYSEANVNKALAFVQGFQASYGGTQIFQPLFETFKRHLKDLPLEVMLLTDGEIWAEEQIFNLINENIRDKGVDARVFALGIGSDVSHTLVEGVARAGNGFSQFVTTDEDTDQKVIRMLKAALYAHTKDYQLEVHYAEQERMDEEDDFEIVEKVNDCLVIKDQAPTSEPTPAAKKTKSLFDTSVDLDKPVIKPEGANRYAHLPSIDTPKVLQAPADMPPMFPFNRTTVYLLLGPESAQKDVKSVTLRAISPQGPLELEIQIQGTQSSTSIHQLAARKAIQDLEEGRGWLHGVTMQNADGKKIPIKKKYESRLDEIVERESVRLGERFQVASKWTSFVAVKDHGDERGETGSEERIDQADVYADQARSRDRERGPRYSRGGTPVFRAAAPMPRMARMAPPPSGHLYGASGQGQPQAQTTSLFGGAATTAFSGGGGLFGSQAPMMQQQSSNTSSSAGGLFGGGQQVMAQKRMAGGSLFGGQTAPQAPVPEQNDAMRFLREESESDEDMGYAPFDDEAPQSAALAPPEAPVSQAVLERYQEEMLEAAQMPLSDDDDPGLGAAPAAAAAASSSAAPPPAKKKRSDHAPTGMAARKALPSENEIMHNLIGIQNFSGSWSWNRQVFDVLGIDEESVDKTKLGGDVDVTITALVVAYFETRLGAKKDVWDMVVAKARSWLITRLGDARKVNEVVHQATTIV